MESRETRLAEQTMEDMTHFMEERHDIIMTHECGTLGRGLREVGDHGRDRIVTLSIGKVVPGNKRPDCSMRVLGL